MERRRLGVRRALVGGEWIDGDVILGADGRVEAVGASPAGARSLAAVPGFVDLQCNGVGSVDFAVATASQLLGAAEALAAEGVVAVTPTYYSCTVDRYVDALTTLDEARRSATVGAHLAGAHLEGPFLAPKWCGAHDPARLVAPDLAVLDRLLAAGPVHRMTVAPELAGIDAVVDRLVDAGVVVSIGHTDADAATCRRALDRGASMMTHVFNAHRRFGARDPGPAGVALADPRVVVSAVADGHHLHPDTLRIVLAAAAGRVAVVSDSVATQVPTGGPVRGHDGRLAGSATPMSGALAHLLSLGIDVRVAVGAVSTVPARVLGWSDHDLRVGSLARIAVVDDRWEVSAVVGSP